MLIPNTQEYLKILKNQIHNYTTNLLHVRNPRKPLKGNYKAYSKQVP